MVIYLWGFLGLIFIQVITVFLLTFGAFWDTVFIQIIVTHLHSPVGLSMTWSSVLPLTWHRAWVTQSCSEAAFPFTRVLCRSTESHSKTVFPPIRVSYLSAIQSRSKPLNPWSWAFLSHPDAVLPFYQHTMPEVTQSRTAGVCLCAGWRDLRQVCSARATQAEQLATRGQCRGCSTQGCQESEGWS